MPIDYKAVFERLPGPLAIVLPDLKVAAVSEGYISLLGTAPQNMIGLELPAILDGSTGGARLKSTSDLRTALKDSLAEKRQVVLPAQDIMLPRADGSLEQRYWNLLNRPLLDGDGRAWAVLHRADDVTEAVGRNVEVVPGDGAFLLAAPESEYIAHRAAANPRSFTSTPDMLGVLDGLLEGVQILDKSLRYLYVNESVVAHSRYAREQLLGHGLLELYPGVEGTPLYQVLRSCLQRGENKVIENAFTFPDGSLGYFELSIQPVEEGLLILSNDITRRVEAQQQVMRMRMVLEETNRQLEARVTQRNQDLRSANEFLAAQMEENRALHQRFQEQHNELLQSLHYARGIQEALFPRPEMLPYFRDVGTLSLPRDVVSGDVFWYAEYRDQLLLALADCTGHGVPGAMMSMLAQGLLERRTTSGITSPELVLDALDRELGGLFTKEDGVGIHDGMDISFLRFDPKTLMLDHAGAFLDCLLLREGVLHVLKADRTSLGGQRQAAMKYFNCTTMPLQEGDRLVLATDGYGSQFGGPADRKFGTAQFKQLLIDTGGQDAGTAIFTLHNAFLEWKGTAEQVDDVMVVLLDV